MKKSQIIFKSTLAVSAIAAFVAPTVAQAATVSVTGTTDGRKTNAAQYSIKIEPRLTDKQGAVVTPKGGTYTIQQIKKVAADGSEAEVQGTFKQYPLRLAWAITIHKSQGLTFEHAIIDAQSSFAAGQVYVALSRCKTLEGLILASPISSSAIINDNLVMNYISHQTEEAEKSIAALPTLKAEYYRQLLLELFSFTDLKACEDALYRVLTEYFYKYPKIITLHKMAIIDLDERIMSISSKWKGIICNMTTDQLHEEDFLQRMKKGALYFHSQLTEIFSHLLDMTKGVQSNNKIAYKRFDNNYADLLQTYVVKHELLERIMEKGFSINSYLTAKQEAILNSLEEKTGRNRKNKIEETTPKVPKISTGEVTFNLFKTGKSIEEIAKERNLTPATIQGHLIPYIQKGEIKLNEVIDEGKAKTILQKIQLAGKEASLKAIKILCPADITYTDILLIMKTTMT